jgi:hypothetical protein
MPKKLSDWAYDIRKDISVYGFSSNSPSLSPEESTMLRILDDILARLMKRAAFREQLMTGEVQCMKDDFFSEASGLGDS